MDQISGTTTKVSSFSFRLLPFSTFSDHISVLFQKFQSLILRFSRFKFYFFLTYKNIKPLRHSLFSVSLSLEIQRILQITCYHTSDREIITNPLFGQTFDLEKSSTPRSRLGFLTSTTSLYLSSAFRPCKPSSRVAERCSWRANRAAAEEVRDRGEERGLPCIKG